MSELDQLREELKRCQDDFDRSLKKNDHLRDRVEKKLRRERQELQLGDEARKLLDMEINVNAREGNVDLTSDYTISMHGQSASYSESNVKKECLGCSQLFDAYYFSSKATSWRCDTLRYCPAYYEHCIRDCEEYKKLDLVRKCVKCKLLLLNPRSYGNHLKKYHNSNAKPQWMTHSTYVRASIASNNPNSTINCPACEKKFKAINSASAKRTQREVAYYVHLIEECDEYKKLNKIRECGNFHCKFINSFTYKVHSCRVKKLVQ